MPKAISGSVGKGGKNRFEDVLIIQYLLNCVPSSKGGPGKELVLDGLCGNLTNGAISKFQLAALGFADGRVDAGGKTIQTLVCYDPYPSMKLTLPSVDGSGKGNGKRGGNPMNNCWDPFGYYNPSNPNYMKSGYEPPPFEGKQDKEIESSMGQKDGGYGWKTGQGQMGQKDGGFGWKTGQGQVGQKDGGYGWKTGQDQMGQKDGGFGWKTGQGQVGQKDGGYGWKTGQDQMGQKDGGFGWKTGQGQIGQKDGGYGGKSGQDQQSNMKGSQGKGGIVGKV